MAETLAVPQEEVEQALLKIFVEAQKNKTESRISSPKEAGRGPNHKILIFALLAITFLVYARSLSFPFMNWDDPNYITENNLIKTFNVQTIHRIFTEPHFSNYIPLTLVSYAADYQLFKLNAFGYHLVNLLFHLANTLGVYFLLFLLSKDKIRSALVAMIFAIHPVQVESVVWISERKNLLSTFFFLPAFIFYIQSKTSEAWRKKGPWLAALLFILACLCKPNIVVFPALIVIYDYLFERNRPKPWPLYALFGFLSLVFVWLLIGFARSGSESSYYGGSFTATMQTMAVVMMKYLQLMIFPVGQNLIYTFPEYTSWLNPHVALSVTGIGLLAAGYVILWKKDKALFFWAAWFLILLLPVLNLIPFPSLMNDRYLYLPLIGFFWIAVTLLQRSLPRASFYLVLGLFLSAYLVMNLNRQTLWAHPTEMWADVQTKSPRAHVVPYRNMGMEYMRKGQLEEAIEQFGKALEIYQDGNLYSAMGSAYYKKGDLKKATEYYTKAIEDSPDQGSFHLNLGLVYQSQKKLDLAYTEIKRAIELGPPSAQFLNNFASLLFEMGRAQEAEDQLKKALEIDPDHADTLNNLGTLASLNGRFQEARKYWAQLLSVHPDYPYADAIRQKLEKLPASDS